MKTPKTVLTRPSLKCFWLGALLIALVQHFFINVRSQDTIFVCGGPCTDSQLQQLRRQAARLHTSEAYYRLSDACERRGDIRDALEYLRQAEALADQE